MDDFINAYFNSLNRPKQISEMIKCIHLFFAKGLNKKTAEMNITGVQLQTLLLLKLSGDAEVNPVDIERRMQLSRPTVTGILTRLESKGHIAFCESKKDKRYKQVTLTERGGRYLDEGKKVLEAMTERLCRGFDEKELDAIYGYLFKMFENLRESEEELC